MNNISVAIAEHTTKTTEKKCFVVINVKIYDSDFHEINTSDRHTSDQKNTKPIVIGGDAFIYSNVKHMKEVIIDNNSVIANESIVASKIPPGVIGGNPAKVLKVIKE